MSSQSDENLMEDYRLSGDSEVMAIIYQRYKAKILNFALRILANRAQAEDVTGEVFLTLFSNKYTSDRNAKFSTWLYTVARNKCIDHIRKRNNVFSLWFKSSTGEEGQFAIADENEIPRDELIKKEAASEVKNALAKLPNNQKEALVLREYQQLSYEEISQVLDCSLENVKVLIYRAREQLRVELKSFLKGDE